MKHNKTLFAALLVTSIGAFAVPASAKKNIEVFVNFAPPALRYEHVPAPRIGFVWAPGYWNWRSNQYLWIGGSWLRDQPGYAYASPRWSRDSRGWYAESGGWNRRDSTHYRDSDHDGIPNYRDRTPYGQVSWRAYQDSDRDGIPNYRDRTPYGQPHYRHRQDGDRDGIPNYRDRFPHDRDNDGRLDRNDRRPYNPRR